MTTFKYTEGGAVDSSVLSFVYYDAETERLLVNFHSNGDTFIYDDFSPEDWQKMVTSDSVGSFYATHVRGFYTGTKADDETVVVEREDEPEPTGNSTGPHLNFPVPTLTVPAGRHGYVVSVFLETDNMKEALAAFDGDEVVRIEKAVNF